MKILKNQTHFCLAAAIFVSITRPMFLVSGEDNKFIAKGKPPLLIKASCDPAI